MLKGLKNIRFGSVLIDMHFFGRIPPKIRQNLPLKDFKGKFCVKNRGTSATFYCYLV
jgi:hypothetical protein